MGKLDLTMNEWTPFIRSQEAACEEIAKVRDQMASLLMHYYCACFYLVSITLLEVFVHILVYGGCGDSIEK